MTLTIEMIEREIEKARQKEGAEIFDARHEAARQYKYATQQKLEEHLSTRTDEHPGATCAVIEPILAHRYPQWHYELMAIGLMPNGIPPQVIDKTFNANLAVLTGCDKFELITEREGKDKNVSWYRPVVGDQHEATSE